MPAPESYLANIQKIDYLDDRLYVLDGNQTLHIYEKE
jgi:hypothetical protein